MKERLGVGRGWGGLSIWDKCKLQLEHQAGSPEGCNMWPLMCHFLDPPPAPSLCLSPSLSVPRAVGSVYPADPGACCTFHACSVGMCGR